VYWYILKQQMADERLVVISALAQKDGSYTKPA
jgi:hypothetical protein